MNFWLWGRYSSRNLLQSKRAQAAVKYLRDVQRGSDGRRYSHSERERHEFARLTKEDVDHFATFLRPNEIVSEANDLIAYNKDWLGRYVGESNLVLKPRSAEQVARVLKYCSHKNLAVCPQGGNTGLVGGSVPVFDEIILSTANLNKIISFDDLSGILTCEAGCILENLQDFVSDKSHIIPLDLGSKGSCHIGGNLATNAGGLRLIRYGSLRGNVLGLEVVLPSGEILDCMSTMRKDNTGYDLKQLFIGSEGTLGIISKVSLLCPPKPNSVAVVFLGCSAFEDVLRTYRIARNHLAEILSSVEFMDHECILLTERNLKLKPPLSHHSFYVLIEVAGACAQHDREKLERFLEDGMNREYIKDGILATDSRHIKTLWEYRERLAEAQKMDGYVYKYDISIPLKNFNDFVTTLRNRAGDKSICCVAYGHLGDGNLHLNFTSKTYDEFVANAIEPFIFELVQKLNGSVSAEHGVGQKHRTNVKYSKTEAIISQMKLIKGQYDPKGILNPYKIFAS